jgi:hypothetical protein
VLAFPEPWVIYWTVGQHLLVHSSLIKRVHNS